MERELEIIARRKGELEERYAQAQARGEDTSKLQEEARQLLAYEQRITASIPQANNQIGSGNVATILCCECGVLTEVNDARLCLACLETKASIVDSISENNSVNYCKTCQRYESRPQWLRCEWESKELLALCLKKIRKPKHLRLVGAEFIWTESHSRRIRVQITVEGEIQNNVTVQQQKVITFVVAHKMCEECCKSLTPHVWVSNVQIRQRSEFKRTMMFLEQLILKNQAHQFASNIVDTQDGLDFHFLKPQNAQAFVQFVKTHLCCKVFPIATQLVGHDCKSNIFRNKYTQIIEVCSINREDLVYVPKKISQQQLGGVPSILICDRISSGIRLIDPLTLQLIDLDAERIFKLTGGGSLGSGSGGAGGYGAGDGIRTLISSTARNLHEFVILDLQPADSRNLGGARTDAHAQLVELELCKCSDLGKVERYVKTVTHLGKILKIGDVVLGYDLACTNLPDNDPELNRILEAFPHEVIVVKKQNAKKKREWEFQVLPKEMVGKAVATPQDADREAVEEDIEDLAAQIGQVSL